MPSNLTLLHFLAQTSYTYLNSPFKWNFRTFEWLNENSYQISYLKPHISFSLNFASLFNVTGDKSSVLFSVKLYMIFTKGAHHSAKYQIFDYSSEISPNLYFDRLYFCWKYMKFQLKKVWRKYVSWYQRVVQNLFFCFKNDKNLVNFHLGIKNSRKFALWLVHFVQSI